MTSSELTRYWFQVGQDALRFNWTKMNWRGALLCLPVFGAWIFVSVLYGGGGWKVFAIAGAVSVSFGAFQKLGKTQVWPMLILLVGIAAGTFLGNLAGHSGWYYWVALATLCGFAFGVMTMLGYATWWIGLQCMIGLLAYGSHSAAALQAGQDALALIAGGASQLIFLTAAGRFVGGAFPHQDQPPLNSPDPLSRALLNNMDPRYHGGQYALRVGAAMAAGTSIAHLWDLPNDYWVPMTAAILMRPDFHEATLRGVNRLLGTLAGAGVLTLLLALTRPAPPVLGLLLLGAILGCLALLRVNYALFVGCVTGYVVLLFATMGLPAPIVALHRVLATLAGATVALLVSLPRVAWFDKKQ